MQSNIKAYTPLDKYGEGYFLFSKLTGKESLSALYEYTAEFLTQRDNIDVNILLGKTVSFRMALSTGEYRYFHGYVTRITTSGGERVNHKMRRYLLTLHPAAWYLSQNRDFRIWQEKSVPEILSAVLSAYKIEYESRLIGQYRQWEYCVQYAESTFDFLSRLMEHEGIYYFFTHQKNGHRLVLADAPEAHHPVAGYDDISFQQPGFGLTDHQEGIQDWRLIHETTASVYGHDDYDFRKPRAHLLETCQHQDRPGHHSGEVFDWPGGFIDGQQGQDYARIRQQASAARQLRMSAQGTARGISAGSRFIFRGGPAGSTDKPYLTTDATYCLQDLRYQSEQQPSSEFSVSCSVIPAGRFWRPARNTPWPKTCGPQTAEVVGPAGRPVWTDQHGRVKLKFRWDRHGAGDDTSSCWVRVASGWAGWKYGCLQVPRVGEEVVVDFINGDPDRPMVIARVYNQDAMPPWELPAGANKMGFVSRSIGGSPENASHLILDDTPGHEQYCQHAERDMQVSVEHNKTLSVGGALDQQITGASRYIHAGPCHTFKKQPDMQIFGLGKSSQVLAGGSTSVVTGGEYRQVSGNIEFNTSQQTILQTGTSLSCRADGNIMFEAGEKIIFGQRLARPRPDIAAINTSDPARPGVQALAEGISDHCASEATDGRPSELVYRHGVVSTVEGGDVRTISNDQRLKIEGDADSRVAGRWQEHAGADRRIGSDADLQLHCEGTMQLSGNNIVNKASDQFEVHAKNGSLVIASIQQVNALRMSTSQMAMENDGMVVSTSQMRMANTQLQVSTVGINISLGNLEMRGSLVSINTSAITLFI
ncbi:type VI secretion system Vgr family protein [Biostraticola tofi]|uniref:Type VI secretion system secreted protein VgrG n=1 Tax=Biostraticola tofi TaxID=466109 RepID=A0A4R3Z3F6_9GAMM|nr:type VI secretion system tip protein TssI/VgrG [Biostraticola tofi]TCV98833.1 type VI secretion system secreted protein VgrG [Biostraticola tofi]